MLAGEADPPAGAPRRLHPEDPIAHRRFGALRCLLFVPASRPERIDKAARSGADAVCLDLEDSVAPSDKEQARRTVARTVEAPPNGVPPLVVRINHPRVSQGLDDLVALAGTLAGGGSPRAEHVAVMIPKVRGVEDVADVRERLGAGGRGVALIPMIETVQGLAAVEAVAREESVVALQFGGLDLSIELGADASWESLLYARSRVVHAARVAGVGALDMPWLSVQDEEGLAVEARRVRGLGFDGKAAIHPRHVPYVLEAFVPTEQEIARATRICEAADRMGEGAFALDGDMIDRPVVEAARRVLARATPPDA